MRIRIWLALASAAVLAGCGDPASFTAPPPQDVAILDGGVERHDVRFPCGETMCAAWLFLPAGDAKAPVVVMGHGFAGTRDTGLGAAAERFASRGIAAFAFDYRHFGASGGMPRQLVDPWQELEDWRSALAFVRAADRVDGTRVAVWGTSLGGGLALITAAEDGNVRAAVAQAPQIDSSVEGEATFPGVWWVIRLLFTAWGDLANDALGGAPTEIAAIAPANGFGMIVDDEAYTAFERIVRPGTTYRNAVLARSIFTFDDYNPAVQAAAIKVPVLLIASRGDRFAPFVAAEAFAKKHPNVTLEEIDGDHFDIYSPPRSEHAGDLAAAFLARHLGPQS
jgi:pimeloyl-ACP methyl ester carboxylesterase